MNIIIHFFLVCLDSNQAVVGEGTESTVDPVHSSDGYSAVLYDNKSGLPTSDANAIAQTEEGFIWIGSYSGLIRYDGNTFVNLSTDAGISSVVSLFNELLKYRYCIYHKFYLFIKN